MSLNPKKYRIIQNKNLLHKFIDKSFLPITIVNKINGVLFDKEDNKITEDEAVELLSKYEKFVFKPTLKTGGGKGVELINVDNNDTETLSVKNHCSVILNCRNITSTLQLLIVSGVLLLI